MLATAGTAYPSLCKRGNGKLNLELPGPPQIIESWMFFALGATASSASILVYAWHSAVLNPMLVSLLLPSCIRTQSF